MMIGAFLLALAMSLLHDLLPEKWSVFIPIPMAMAIPFYVGANVALDISTGAVVKAY
jgi:branched-subunit amino acid ABC-type transport system permease component